VTLAPVYFADITNLGMKAKLSQKAAHVQKKQMDLLVSSVRSHFSAASTSSSRTCVSA
jgi:hypothetical protein